MGDVNLAVGSDHEVVACYSRLYEEREVDHINGPTHPSLWGVSMYDVDYHLDFAPF